MSMALSKEERIRRRTAAAVMFTATEPLQGEPVPHPAGTAVYRAVIATNSRRTEERIRFIQSTGNTTAAFVMPDTAWPTRAGMRRIMSTPRCRWTGRSAARWGREVRSAELPKPVQIPIAMETFYMGTTIRRSGRRPSAAAGATPWLQNQEGMRRIAAKDSTVTRATAVLPPTRPPTGRFM